MDERDEYESEADRAAEPVTERVRITGAEPVGEAGGTDEVAWDTAPASDRGAAASRHYLGFDDHEQDSTEPTMAVGSNLSEPELVAPDLPHWTEPATGQVPAVLDRRGDDDDTWAAGDAGPAWREHQHEWDEASFEPAMLADDETRVGALDDAAPPESHQWEFREFGEGDESGVTAAPDVSEAIRTPVLGDEEETPADIDDDRPFEPVAPATGPAARAEGESDGGAGDGAGAGSWVIAAPEVVAPVAEAAEPDAPALKIGRAGPAPVTPPESIPAAAPVAAAARPRPRQSAGRSGAATRNGAPPTGRRNVPAAVATGIGAAVVALVCFALGTVATVTLATVVVTLAAAECFAALRRAGWRPATLLGLFACAGLMVAAYAKGVAAFPLVIALTLVATMVWYLVGAERGSPVRGISATFLGFAWVGVLGGFAGLLLAPSQYPNRHGIAFILGAVVAVVGADIGALVVGSWIGRHPLTPRVSPNKTWEGFFGGLVAAVVLSVVITGHVHPWTPGKAAVLGLVAAVVGPIGDLCESLVKRDLGLKDMGSMLPGHGGVLDRVDALLFVLPATYYLVRVLHLG